MVPALVLGRLEDVYRVEQVSSQQSHRAEQHRGVRDVRACLSEFVKDQGSPRFKAAHLSTFYERFHS